MSERVRGYWFEWPDVVVVVSMAIVALGLAVWSVQIPTEWASIPRLALILPVGLVAYWFGRRWAWIAAATGASLNLVALSVLSPNFFPPLSSATVEGLFASALLFPVALMAARWGEQGRIVGPVEPLARQPLDKAEMLGRIGAAISGDLDLKVALDAILSSIHRLIFYDLAEITLWDEERQGCVTQGWGGEDEQAYTRGTGGIYYLDEGFTGWIARHHRPLLIPDVQARHDVRPKLDTPQYPMQSYVGIPLLSRGLFVGTLELVSYQRDFAYSEHDVETLQAVGNQAAVAIENAYLYTEMRRRASELASLARISATVSESLELEHVLQTIASAVLEVVGCQMSAIFVLDETQQVLRLAMTQGLSEEYAAQSQVLTLERGGRAHAVATGEPLIIPDLQADESLLAFAPISIQEGFRAFADLPLKRADRVIGMLSVAFVEPHRFFSIEIELLTAFADQAAIAIENARLYVRTDEELRRQEEALSGLRRVSREISTTLDLPPILYMVLKEAMRLGKATGGVFVLRDAESGKLKLEVCAGYSEAEEAHIRTVLEAPEAHPALAAVLRTNQSLLVLDVATEEREVVLVPRAGATRSVLIVPVFYAGILAGLIFLESTEEVAFDQMALEVIEGLSAQAAIAIGNAQRYQEQLERRNLLHRRADQLASVLEISRALRSDRPLEEVLEEVAYAIEESVGFNVVLISILEGDPPQQRRMAAAGVPIADFERMREVRQPWSLVESVMLEEFRISQSYYIPGERDEIWRDRVDTYGEDVDGLERELGRWHPDDMLLVPLVGPGGDVRGLLSVDQPRDGRIPDRSTIESLEIFAAQAALVIENAHMMETLQRRAEILTLFNEISQSAAAKLELSEVLDNVVKTAPQLLACDQSSIFLLDPQSGQYVPRAVYGSALEPVSTQRRVAACAATRLSFAPGEGLVGEVAQSGMPLAVDDMREESRPFLGSDADVGAVVLTPLTVRNQVVGVLCASHQQPHESSPAEVAMLSALADQVAVAVENARLFDEARRRAIQLEAAAEVARGATATLDVDRLLDETVHLISDRFGFYHAGVFLVDEQGDAPQAVLRAASSKGGQHMLKRGHRLAVGEVGIVGYVAGTGEYRIALDVGEDAAHFVNPDLPDTRSEMALSLVSRGQIIGVLDVQSVRETAFTEEDVAVLQTMADQLANAIANARLFEETASRAERLAVVNRIARAAGAATLNLDDLMETVYREIASIFQADTFFIALYDEKTNELEFPLVMEDGVRETIEQSSLSGLTSFVITEKKPLLVRDLEREGDDLPPPVLFSEGFTPSWLGVPMLVGERVIGVISVQSYRPYAYGEEEQLLLSTIADQVAVAVENARLFEEVRSFSQELERRVEARTQELADAMEELTAERDRVETLYRITSELAASLDLDHVLNRALKLTVEAVEADQASILMLESHTLAGEVEPSRRLINRAAWGKEVTLPTGGAPTRFSKGEGLVGWVVEHREAAIVSDIRQDPRWVESQGQERKYRSALAIPLVAGGGDMQGALLLLHTQPGHFNEDHLRLVETSGVQVTNAINNAELYNLIRQQAERLGSMLKTQQVEAAKSQAVLEGVADGVMVADAEGRVILFNAAAERILDLPRERALGQMTREMLGLYGGQADWVKTVAKWAEDPEAYATEEYLAAQLDIEDRVVSVHLAPVLMTDEFLGTVSVFRDITVEVESARAKVEFVSMVSHELRTPMTSIKGYADLLLMGAAGVLADEQRKFLSVIKSNVDRLTTLVNDLLDISRMESGRMTLSLELIRLADVTNQVIMAMATRTREKGLGLRSDIPPDLPEVQADSDRVIQILTNLVANACQYTPTGGEIVVSACVRDDEMRVSVRDTGIGIAPEDRENIFTRFFRVDHPLVHETTGTGLGLDIVKSLVEMHGGRVEVESKVGVGSTFTFTLPMRRDEPSEIPERVSTKVLLVEDDLDIARQIQRHLTKNGQEVLIARQSDEALELAQRERLDLIALDILLPGATGFDLIEEFKSHPRTQETPVLVIPIVPDHGELRLGAVDYVTKPVGEEQLLRAVRQVLAERGTVLVVDDDRDNLSWMREVLRANDFGVRTTSLGRRVLRVAREEQPALVLLDFNLQDLDGQVILKRLKSDPATQDIPVIVMTECAIMDHTKQRQIFVPRTARFVAEPFSVEELTEEIERVLRRRF
jgi:PAS domain S-box-containing protein